MKLDLPERKKLVHEMVVPIRWGDMDAMGHVNNTLYFRYMEIARIDWMMSIGALPEPGGEGFTLINAFCNFHQQLQYPGDLLVRTYVSDVGRSSFESWVTMERTDEPGVLSASAGATTVWIDFAKGKSAPLPERLRTQLE